jgi:mono/diheme cytochrome c family protein
MKYFISFLLILTCLLFTASSFRVADGQDWPVPDKYKKMANPVKADAASIAEGKSLWAKHCQSCHGKTGLGDGSKAAQLKTEPGDFTKDAVQSQPDGSLFYKIQEGREDMPSFKKKIPEQEDIWNVINFMRTLKKK